MKFDCLKKYPSFNCKIVHCSGMVGVSVASYLVACFLSKWHLCDDQYTEFSIEDMDDFYEMMVYQIPDQATICQIG